MKKTTIVFFILLGYLYNLQAQTSAITQKIDNYLKAGTTNGFSGAISIVQDGKIILNKGYGLANKHTQTINSPNTIFDIGSNTKQFTSVAILKLVELNKLNLDDTLSNFFKELPKDKQKITIHQLLTHTAGFVDAIGKDFDKITEEDFFKQLFTSKLINIPGEKYNYSNTGYSILGKVIELVSKQSYEQFINKHLLTPAGMQQTGYFIPKWKKNNLSKSYNRDILEGEATVLRYQKDGEIYWHLKANGGFNSTQNDMLLWYKALQNNSILSKVNTQKLITPYIQHSNPKYSYAYGWLIRTYDDGIKMVAHNGSNGAYAHSTIWYPEQNSYIIYSTNTNSSKVEYLAYTVAKMLRDETITPIPIQNNVYAYTMDYISKNKSEKITELLTLLKENYADEVNSSRFLNSFGNLLLRLNKNTDWAIALFEQNVILYPTDGNLWDSLGDGYAANKLYKKAINSYQKAVTLGYKDSQEKIVKLKSN